MPIKSSKTEEKTLLSEVVDPMPISVIVVVVIVGFAAASIVVSAVQQVGKQIDQLNDRLDNME